ncbi:hypothetical protein QVD17_08721 [Tagetes erecta]|uniref:Secreted protein n=1 Tax=Tagetes erecta TaxID=13708 RepID=A0AAD8KZR2_TARER|nr:hypothetical protein QVD17_08721 [Tagetes erecta]
MNPHKSLSLIFETMELLLLHIYCTTTVSTNHNSTTVTTNHNSTTVNRLEPPSQPAPNTTDHHHSPSPSSISLLQNRWYTITPLSPLLLCTTTTTHCSS